MNKEEIKFYSIGRGSLNLDGKFYYGLDYAITDFMRNLEQENKELHNRIDKAIEILKLCNSQCAKETIEILKDSDVK